MFYEVVKVAGGYGVQDWNGEVVTAYRDRKTVERRAFTMTLCLYTAAEEYDMRRTYVLAYLASRKARVPAINNQLNLF